MKLLKRSLTAIMVFSPLVACATVSQSGQESASAQVSTQKKCHVNPEIGRNAIPQTPNNMSLPNFGQGVIGWATGPEGAAARLKTVSKADISTFKAKGVTLAMVQEWQAFYENEVKRNPCNPTAPYRAELMKKIAVLWVK